MRCSFSVFLARAESFKDEMSPELNVFIYFSLIVNIIFIPFLTLTFLLAPKVKRHPCVINLCITLSLSGVYFLLLYFANVSNVSNEPSKTLCIIQTSFISGTPPTWAVVVLMLVYNLLDTFSDNTQRLNQRKMKVYLMVIAPYVAQFAFFLPTLLLSLQYPERVTRPKNYVYCSLNFVPLFGAVTGCTVIICMAIILLEWYLAIKLHRHWRVLKTAGRPAGINFSVALRVVAFGFYVLIGIIVNILLVFNPTSSAGVMYMATAGTVVLLVFGTHVDVLTAWWTCIAYILRLFSCNRRGNKRAVMAQRMSPLNDSSQQLCPDRTTSRDSDLLAPSYYLEPHQRLTPLHLVTHHPQPPLRPPRPHRPPTHLSLESLYVDPHS
ncbi:hypothetical protein AMATHDRAFT_837 [Amanita thiersii Skay4041]|uniref:G-protein coupled receptors family 1 profile domain-containing protein n=1 Tax=Amanita thiersii Skay4041 TaxID=703135 RepID=A0A2A9NVC0_9AGAR|nr:hypothetical protein AMATHDRAFT_837 [Amanita thiersii Skay4041]